MVMPNQRIVDGSAMVFFSLVFDRKTGPSESLDLEISSRLHHTEAQNSTEEHHHIITVTSVLPDATGLNTVTQCSPTPPSLKLSLTSLLANATAT
tara:strand:+ start:441 stop:725 length:285 start_codon:yes stop_codon:yes gene_type:complete